MKTKLEELLKTVNAGIESLKDDAGTKDSGFTPPLGTALGGLRTAKAGIEGHLKATAPQTPAAPTK